VPGRSPATIDIRTLLHGFTQAFIPRSVARATHSRKHDHRGRCPIMCDLLATPTAGPRTGAQHAIAGAVKVIPHAALEQDRAAVRGQR
jgi:hypothetical protein